MSDIVMGNVTDLTAERDALAAEVAALKAQLAETPDPTPDPVARVHRGAVDALAAYTQGDMDGIMVLVSRQAIEECLPALRALAGETET